jgi:hypothetical protein
MQLGHGAWINLTEVPALQSPSIIGIRYVVSAVYARYSHSLAQSKASGQLIWLEVLHDESFSS